MYYFFMCTERSSNRSSLIGFFNVFPDVAGLGLFVLLSLVLRMLPLLLKQDCLCEQTSFPSATPICFLALFPIA